MTNATDAVADDMLRRDDMLSFAGQIEAFRLHQREAHFAMFGRTVPAQKVHEVTRSLGDRLPRRKYGNGVNLHQATRWLALCEVLCRSAGDFDHETRRGWVIACRLLGLGWSDTQLALRDVRDFGAAAAASVWSVYLSEPDERFVGQVYTASAVHRPTIIKVGFSRRPYQRVRQLERTQHCAVKLHSCRVGTMLHEWALHHLMLGAVEPEWYPANIVPRFVSEGSSIQ